MRKVVGEAPFWEPFCGGANVTMHLAMTGRPGKASDIHPALIALYHAIQGGWDPPMNVSKEEYDAAKTLPDSDPRKAFIGFCCSFGGKYFGGYAKPRPSQWNNAAGGRKVLLKQFEHLRSWEFGCYSFFDVPPEPTDLALYCDPPYQGTTGYSSGKFPHDEFWARCQEWSRHTTVFVSEYSCPVACRLVWEKTVARYLKSQDSEVHTEKLFQVLPDGPPRVERQEAGDVFDQFEP